MTVSGQVADPLAFLQLLLGLVEDGRRTATYELAVLLSDCCASASGPRGGAPEVIGTRTPDDGLTNLVLADERCNLTKSDNLADLALLERWGGRRADVLAQVGGAARWPLRRQESLAIARSVYGHQSAGSPLWTGPGVFALLDVERRDALLPLLGAA